MVQIPESKDYDVNAESRLVMNTILSNAYEAEWQRTRDIESKACSIVGFTGIIFTLIIGTLSSFLVNDKEGTMVSTLFSHWYSKIVIVVILSYMVLSIYYGIKALSVKGWEMVSGKDIWKRYRNSSEPLTLKQELIGSMNQSYFDCIYVNCDLTDKKALYVKYSHDYFLLSIILMAVYFLCVVIYLSGGT